MAAATMNDLKWRCLPLLAPMALLACSPQPTVPAEAPLAGARIGGPFTLVDQTGATVTDRDFAGRYRLMYFGYSYCPDVCPVDLQTLMQGLQRFERQNPALANRIAPIFVTIDPERDTPTVLRAYVTAFHPRLVGLTGSPAQIADVAKRFAVSYRKGEATKPGEYLVDHSRQAYLLGPDGAPIALVPQDETADAVAAELKRWVR